MKNGGFRSGGAQEETKQGSCKACVMAVDKSKMWHEMVIVIIYLNGRQDSNVTLIN
jgi:hypothetical protein